MTARFRSYALTLPMMASRPRAVAWPRACRTSWKTTPIDAPDVEGLTTIASPRLPGN